MQANTTQITIAFEKLLLANSLAIGGVLNFPGKCAFK